MHHAYKESYNVLPNLMPLKTCPFDITADVDRFCAEKQDAIKNQPVFLKHNISEEIFPDICEYIVNNFPVKLNPPFLFENLAMQIQEDLAIHRLEETDWLAATHICFPSHWDPILKIGKPLAEIHAPIPGINLKMSRKWVETMIYHGPFERYVWSMTFEDRINNHPRFASKIFDPKNPIVYIKIEKQITVGFPKHKAALFILRQYILKDIDKQALAKTIQNMNPEQRKYKGIDYCFDDLLNYLTEV